MHLLIMALHDVILRDNLEENDDYPEGITSEELSELSRSFGQRVHFLFVPADLVPESTTSQRIVRLGQDLDSFYVVYRRFSRGVGHDSTYG